jgi:hypothetical protein
MAQTNANLIWKTALLCGPYQPSNTASFTLRHR